MESPNIILGGDCDLWFTIILHISLASIPYACIFHWLETEGPSFVLLVTGRYEKYPGESALVLYPIVIGTYVYKSPNIQIPILKVFNREA